MWKIQKIDTQKKSCLIFIFAAATIFISSASFALKAPHTNTEKYSVNCSSCHVSPSTSPPGFYALTSFEAHCFNEQVGCHNANPGTKPDASRKAFATRNASNRFGNLPTVSGAKQSSHGWKIPNTNTDAGVTQTWAPMKEFGDSRTLNLKSKIYCTRCHRAHGDYGPKGETIYSKFLKADPKGDNICFQCHTARRISNVRDAKSSDKHYSHPVEINYSSVQASKSDRFEKTPLNPYSSNLSAALKLYTTYGTNGTDGTRGAVVCSTCHGPIHSSDSNPYTLDNITTYSKTGNYSTSEGNLLRRYPAKKSNDLCVSCHKVTAHRGFLCAVCHTPHKKANENNRYLIYENISTPNSGSKAVLFTSTSQMARRWQDNTQPTPVCQVCHTQTRHHRNYSTAEADRTHNYISGNNYKYCAATCHKHTNSFSHGAGAGGGQVEDCLPCHGHDPGYKFTYNMVNYSSQGTGNRVTHSTHTENDSDDQRGPNIFCDSCHDINNMPYFKTGTDANSNGFYELSETDVCDTCHSPGGTYNGVNSTNGSVGAKDNFKASNGDYANGGVYNSDGTLKTGKDKWCAGCHDEEASVISLVTAPNVIGDENGAYAYGVGWGFYKTGHGLSSGNYPASEAPASARNCPDCHNSTVSHIDGEHRTYSVASDNYQAGYRLRLGMDIPRTDTGEPESDFELCFSCHASGPFLTQNNYTTNFRQDTTRNDHWFHLQSPSTGMWASGDFWDSDWDGTADSKINCPACHNVHGSPSPKMIRHGELISTPGTTDKVPALNFKYLPLTSPVLMNSTGGIINPTSPGAGTVANTGVCNMCHSNQESYTRTPRDIYPPWITGVYGAVGSNRLFVNFSKGVYTDTGASGALVLSDFAFADADNGRTMTGINHSAGDDFAIITLSTDIDGVDDIDTDSLAAATSSIYDAYDNTMDASAVVITGDTVIPAASNFDPSDGAEDISIDKSLTVTLTDSDAGIDFSAFSITLSGNKGYNKTYTDLDTSAVTKSGTRKSYSVAINPDTNFSHDEVITVTVNVDDYAGNSLSHPSWSFTTSAGAVPQTITIHPSGVDNAYSFTTYGGDWADVLDGNDSLSTYVHRCGGSGYPGDSTSRFSVAMDDSGLGSVTVQSIEIGVAVKYAPSCPTNGTTSGTMGICYKTGTNTVCIDSSVSGDFTVYTATFTTDSDGGALDVSDINNMIVEIQRKSTGSIHLIASEVYVNITYLP